MEVAVSIGGRQHLLIRSSVTKEIPHYFQLDQFSLKELFSSTHIDNDVPVLQKPIKVKNLQIRLFSFGVALCPNDFFCREAWGFLVENDSVLFYKMQKKKDIYY